MMELTREQLECWNDNGYVFIPGYVPKEELGRLTDWTGELEALPETPGKWMKYFERSAHNDRQLCRVENFIQYHEGFRGLLESERTYGILEKLMNEPAVLFKEKINFKLPGGKGFKQHQDAPAFTTFGQKYHITLMLTVDPATVENGCLELVRGSHRKGIFPQEADGTIRADVVQSMKWEHLPMAPGDALFFDSYIPHGSAANRSVRPRRALYVTYNRKSEGSVRDAYFADKRRTFPPECERVPGVDYTKSAGVYNLGNPID